jgi:hypothetical protein
MLVLLKKESEWRLARERHVERRGKLPKERDEHFIADIVF